MALLQTRWSRLREWAYAGFVINLVGATSSHLFTGDPLGVAIVPTLFLIPLAISSALRPEQTETTSRSTTTRPIPAAA